jgi:hypothetical protein
MRRTMVVTTGVLAATPLALPAHVKFAGTPAAGGAA